MKRWLYLLVILSLLLSLFPLPAVAGDTETSAPEIPQETGGLRVMVPHPDLVEQWKASGAPEAIIRQLQAQAALALPSQRTTPSGAYNAIALLVQFTDKPNQVGEVYFDQLLFGLPPVGSLSSGTLKDYYNEVSYGILDIVTLNLPSSLGWLTAPQTYGYYVLPGSFGFGPYPNNVQKLVEDAVLAANPLVNFAPYDNDLDGDVDALFVVHAGPGAEFTGNGSDIWSHRWVTQTPPLVDGVLATDYVMVPEYWNPPPPSPERPFTISIPQSEAEPLEPGSALPEGAPVGERAQQLVVNDLIVADPPIDVLFLTGGDSAGAIRGILDAFPDIATVGYIDGGGTTPTLAQLQAYDAVITFQLWPWADANAIGNVLADYVDAGGNVVQATPYVASSIISSGWGIQGRWRSEGYSPMLGPDAMSGLTSCLGAYDPAHPIMEGVGGACDYYRTFGTSLAADATWVADWADGWHFIATRDPAGGRIVGVNSYPGDFSQWGGDIPLILHNALVWASGGQQPPPSGDMTVGVMAHELGHAWDLPDLYDIDYSSAGVGVWSIMSFGSWAGPGGMGESPSHPDAWSRSFLGFATPTDFLPSPSRPAPVVTPGVSFPAVETSGFIARLPVAGVPGEYFLVENRQPIGYDSYLPGYGLLIWHIDDNINPGDNTDNSLQCSQLNNWNCGLAHQRVALEQADGLWQLEWYASYGDPGDPFPGSSGNTNFNGSTVPNSSSYYSPSPTYIGVNNISPSGAVMTADLSNGLPPGGNIVVDTSPISETGEQGYVWTRPFTIGNNGGGPITFSLSDDALAAPQRPFTISVPQAAPSGGGASLAQGAPAGERPQQIEVRDLIVASPPIDVLLLAADNAATIQGILPGFPDIASVGYFDGRFGTPTLAQLQAYDAVMAWGDYPWADRTAIGNVLADYVDGGGNVVQTVFGFAGGAFGPWDIGGRWFSQGYSPLVSTIGLYSYFCLGAFDPAHPIMDGVVGACDFYRENAVPAPDATLVADWADGWPFIATRDPAGGRIVGVNSYPGDNWVWSGDTPLILHNALVWASGSVGVDWLNEVPDSGVVDPGSSVPVDLVFNSNLPLGTYNATLTVNSNDPETPSIPIPVSMEVTVSLPPDIWVDPTSFAEALPLGGTVTRTLTVGNNGTGGLDFNVEIVSPPLSPAPARQGGEPQPPPNKGEPDLRVGVPPQRGAGGPDGFGYTWKDSDELGGPTFNWIDITGTGSVLSLSDDSYASVPLGFSFDFYGVDNTNIFIGSNGLLCFLEAGCSVYWNEPIPTSWDPNAIVAPLWDDMNPDGEPRIFYQTIGDQFVVTWNDVRFFGSTERATFQAILGPGPAIRFQYLAVDELGQGGGSQATTGIENQMGSDGLQVNFNAAYLHDGLAILFSRGWLDVFPTSGVVQPGQSLSLDVVFNAIFLGLNQAIIRIWSNDPDESPLDIPAELLVGSPPDIDLSPANEVVAGVIQDQTGTRPVTIRNLGVEDLSWSASEGTNPSLPCDTPGDVPWLSFGPTSGILGFNQEQTMIVGFDATGLALGEYRGCLRFTSNDPDEGIRDLLVRMLVVSGLGGPMMMAGHDADDHGFPDVYAGLFNALLSWVMSGGSGILAIGADPGTSAGDWIQTVASLMTPPQAVTFVNDAAISTVDFMPYAILHVPSDANDTWGGITQGEYDLLNARAADVAQFINLGGGLFSITPGQFANPFGFLGLVGGFEILSIDPSGYLPSGQLYDDVSATAEGLSLGITDTNLDGCCWHNVFTVFPAFLQVLAVANEPFDPPFHNQASIIGGSQVQISGFTLVPAQDTNLVGTQHTVTAIVSQSGAPVPGAVVDFNITGANNLTGSCVTDVNGQCTFTYTGANVGSDTIVGTTVVDTETLTATAFKTWVPYIDLTPDSDVNPVGSDHTVVAITTDQNGNPVSNILVDFLVTAGPHMGASGSAITDAGGQASFTYIGEFFGVDTIQACVAGSQVCDTATKEWGPVIDLQPDVDSNPVGSDHTVVATLTDVMGMPVSGVVVHFVVTAGPNLGVWGGGISDFGGQTPFTYTGLGGPGTDTIQVCVGLLAVSGICDTATKEWVEEHIWPENPSFSVKAGGPSGFRGADILMLGPTPGAPPVVAFTAENLFLAGADDIDALSYGQDYIPVSPSRSPSGQTSAQEVCGNAQDDDGDGLVDEGCSGTVAGSGEPVGPPLSPALGDYVASVYFSEPCANGVGVGITYDGANLWYSCVVSSPDLYRADPFTGQVTASYTITGDLGALAYDAGRNALWAGWGGYNTGDIYLIQLDGAKNVVGSSVVFNTGGHPIVYSLLDGLAYDATDDTLYISDDGSTTIHHYDLNGIELNEFPWAGTGCYNSGLALGGQMLYEGSDGCSWVWVVEKTNPSVLVFDFPTAIPGDPSFRDEDLECDTNTFAGQGQHVMWSVEAYEPRRAHAFEIEFGSCGIGGQPAWPGWLNFSVRPEAIGLPGTDVNMEASKVPPEAHGDEYTVPFPGFNVQVFDEDGSSAWPFGLLISDDVDALDNMPPSMVDINGDGIPDIPVYFSLAPGSPTLGALGVGPGHILAVGSGPLVVFATPPQLGLGPGDDIDAIALIENGNGIFDPATFANPDGDILVFSLAAGSPTLIALGASPGALFVPNKDQPGVLPPMLAFPAWASGLLFADDLNALKADALFLWEHAPFLFADLEIVKTDSPDPVSVGADLTYTLTITNNGPDAVNATVTDTLPSTVTVVSVTPSQGTCSVAGGVVNCDLSLLGPGASATIIIVVTPSQEGVITNVASVSGDLPDPNLANDVAQETTTVVALPLEPDINVVPPGVEVWMDTDSFFDVFLDINNLGGANLDWSLVENPLVGWLSENPTSGTVLPLDTEIVTLSLNSTGLALGDYNTSLDITSNDPDEGLVSVPVLLHVLQLAKVVIGSASLASGASGTVPVTVENITNPDGLGGYDFSLAWDPAIIQVDSITGDPAFDPSPVASIDNVAGTATFNGLWAGVPPGPTGDVPVAHVNFTAVGTPGSSTVLDIWINPGGLVDTNAVDIPAIDVDGLVEIVFILAETDKVMGQDKVDGLVSILNDGATGIATKIIRVYDPSTNTDLPVVLGGYDAKLTYDPVGINILGVRGVPPWDEPVANIQNGAGWTSFNGLCPTGCPYPTLTAFALTRLGGSVLVSYDLTLEWVGITDVDGGAISPEGTVTNTFQRGDIRNDGIITIGDALFGQQYLAGIRALDPVGGDLTKVNPVNMASVKHDQYTDPQGVVVQRDIKTIADVLFLRQYLAGLRDAFMNQI